MGAVDDYIKEKQAETAAAVATEETAETTTEETTEQNTETTEETQTEETQEETTETTAVQELNDEQLNTFFETTGKNKEDIKGVYTLGAKYSELEGKHNEVTQELDALKLQNAEIKKGLDPLSYFSSEQNYIAEQLRKKYPDMDVVAIQRSVTQDLSQMTDLDVLALKDVIKHPGVSGGELMAKKILADDYGVDLSEPTEQWDELARAKIQRDAIAARNELKTFHGEIELPTAKSEEDLKAERAKEADDLKVRWAPALLKMTDLDKITLPRAEEGQVFVFEVPQAFRDGLGDYFNDVIVNGGLEPNDDTVKFLMEQRNKDVIYQNLDKIMAAFEADITSKLTKKTDDELNNNDPANTNKKPDDGQEISGTDAWLSKQPGRNRRT